MLLLPLLLLLLLSGGRDAGVKGGVVGLGLGLGLGLELGVVAISVDWLELGDGLEQAKFFRITVNDLQGALAEASNSEA